jgi:hypothetical protein
MTTRFTNAQFDALIASDAANEDIVGILKDVFQDQASWVIFEGMIALSQARAMHRIAGALQGLVIEADLKAKRSL